MLVLEYIEFFPHNHEFCLRIMDVVRKAKIDEAQAIIDLHADTIRRVNSKDYTPTQIESWIGKPNLEFYKSAIRDGEFYVYVTENGSILGEGHLNKNAIFGLYVSADHLGKGIGSAILERMEDDAVNAGFTELRTTSTITALGFWRSKGYEELEHIKFGKAELHAVKMRKNIRKTSQARRSEQLAAAHPRR